ncbi:acyl-CoA dehydrogenase [Desulfobotulus sp.]|jgi:alkylation response protein AidB-like acyl-CoA dehydrogenase|uniref:acyl-CoA dehydrogenase n=1 Tax=Desulfobotulus sp. TaxID=1940337 RepID=UPI002A35D14E|nr:acyl-CoA dehydrogenase [Desulfobotulus sp.]MDY0163186.1 acyl-CoA dehydrogenase [Desulfobotulus sp.]
MAQVISERRDVDFVLHEQLEVGKFAEKEKFADFNKKTVDMIVNEARNLAIKELLPTWKDGDTIGCTFENGKVRIPESFVRAYDLLKKGEWTAMSEAPEWGGQGMPKTVALAASEFFNGANYPFMMYPGLTHGAGKLVETFGTEKQKKLFLKNIYTGEWCGTMLLTEACAGSDVGALETVAYPQADGTYKIVGNKIFISGGEQEQLSPNIVHPVLARIEGAPAGTKGISLFLVPKFRVNDDGSLGAFNDVVCTGIEHKMGIHGNCTCSLALGGKNECIGELLGEPNKGMAHMFLMMNEARQLVGMQGFACGSAAYMYALNYAKERVQGALLTNPKGGGVPIIQHPDVRRQLMMMKSYTEAMRSILYYLAYCDDMAHLAESAEEKELYEGLVEVLTPIGKGYVTDRSFEVVSQGMQVYGGYGFIEEYPLAQLLRDVRITLIYEGTNGIQAMDLLGRKLGMKKGKIFMSLLQKIGATVAQAKGVEALAPLAAQTEATLNKLGEVAMHMGKTAMSEKVMVAFSQAHPFLDVVGDLTAAWMLLWRATIAQSKLGQKKKEDAFYKGVIKSAEFFIYNQLPVTEGKMNAILRSADAAVAIEEESFLS